MIAFTSQPVLVWHTGDLIPGESPDTVAVIWPAGSDTVLSVQADGTFQSRPATAIGPWESAQRIGDKLVYRGTGTTWVLPLIDGIV